MTNIFPETTEARDGILTFEEVQQFNHEAQQWLPRQLRGYPGEITSCTQTYKEWNDVLAHLQSWGGIEERIIKQAGVSVEFGGPSQVSRFDVMPGFKPDYVSNIVSESMVGRACEMATGPINLAADVRRMPFADASLGSTKMAALPRVRQVDNWALNHINGLREAAIAEAARVTKLGGFLVWERGTVGNFETIREAGFEPVSVVAISSINLASIGPNSDDVIYMHPCVEVNGVFQKQA